MTTTHVAEPAKNQGSAARNPHRLIIDAAHAASSTDEFLAHAFRHTAASFDSPYAAVSVREASRVFEHTYHSGPTDPGFWRDAVQQFLTESLTDPTGRAKLLNPKRGSTKVAFLSAPIFDAAGGHIGTTAMVIVRQDGVDVSGRLALLESLACLTGAAIDLVGVRSGAGDRTVGRAPDDAFARAGGFASDERLAFAITNNLRNKLGCVQVALGSVRRKRVKVVSISGLDRVASRSRGVAGLKAAMEECLDAQRPLIDQEQRHGDRGDGRTGVPRLHHMWRVAAGHDSVASIPLRFEEKIVAILSLRQRRDEPFTPELIEKIRQNVEPFAAALVLAQRASRGLFTHAREAVGEGIAAITTSGHVGAKVAVLAAAACMGWFFVGSTDYSLTVPCTVVPAAARHVAVPFDGVLESVAVTTGDHVRTGQVLCALGRRDLEQHRAELLAQINVHERRKDRALAEESPVEYQLELAEQQSARARLATLEARIARASVLSPVDGVVVVGDLRERVGSVVTRGEPLFTVAPKGEYRLRLHVPERDFDEILADAPGRFAAQARPEDAYEFRLTRISPAAEIVDGRNVFVAEAAIGNVPKWMRPGMEGVAKIAAGRRPIRWVVFHRLLDFLRMKLWL